MRSAGIASWILAVPTFDDFWMICATVSRPFECESLIVHLPIFMLPGAVWKVVPGFTSPESRAAATVNGLKVEPGS